MEKCINCNKNETDKKYEFYIIRTFKVKENKKRVKKDEVAGVVDCYLCDKCLEKYISDSGNIFKSMIRICIVPVILLVLAIVSGFVGDQSTNPIITSVLFSLIAVYCIYSGYKECKKKADAINNGMTNKLKRQLITDLITVNLPTKDKKGKLAYIMTDRVMNDNHNELKEETGISLEMLAKVKRLKKNENK